MVYFLSPQLLVPWTFHLSTVMQRTASVHYLLPGRFWGAFRFLPASELHCFSITDQLPWYEYTPCGLFIHQLVAIWAILTLDTYEYHSYKYLSMNFCMETCFPSLGFVLWSRAAGLCGLEFLEVSRGLYHFIPHQQSCPLIPVVYEWYLIVVLTCTSWQWQWLVTKFVGHLSILFRKKCLFMSFDCFWTGLFSF